MLSNSWFKKMAPIVGVSGLGGGVTGWLVSGGGDPWEPAGITATGGTMHTGQANPDGTPYTWHVFPGGPRGPESPTPYTFSVTGVTGPGKIEYILMGGGGQGGMSPNPDPANPTSYDGAGGGGAGGVICNFQSPPANPGSNHPFYPLSPGAMTVSASPGSYAIEVGRAAAGNPAPERDGKPSTFAGLTAIGGGCAAHSNAGGASANPGGSGGGGGAAPGPQTGGSGTTNQGHDGGDGGPNTAGGGGGAAGAGNPGPNPNPPGGGRGGDGIMFDDAGYFKLSVGGIADNPTQPGYKYLAGGGGGGGPENSGGNPPGAGGFGGGGEAGNPNNNAGNADNWSGAGGGGAGGGDQTRQSGQGGQGMLFIRYVD